MKRSRNPRGLGGLLALILLGMTLAACGGSQTQVVCPISYDAAGAEACFVGDVKNANTQQAMPAVQLRQNEIGLFQPPGQHGDRPVEIQRGIGYHSVPDQYTFRIPGNIRSYRTFGDPTNRTKCSEEQFNWGECDYSLDGIQLKNAVEIVVDIEVDYEVIVTDKTADEIVVMGGYSPLLAQFKSYMRTAFRDSQSVSIDEYRAGTLKSTLQKQWRPLLDKWQHANLIKIHDLRIRSAERVGVDTQGEQKAEAFATQVTIACPPNAYPNDAARAECAKAYVWSTKSDSSQPPAAAPNGGTPAPAP